MLQRRVEFLPGAARIFNGFQEVDRNERGGLVFRSMVAVLDEYGWHELDERRMVRRCWRAMRAVEVEFEEKRRAADGRGKGGKRGRFLSDAGDEGDEE